MSSDGSWVEYLEGELQTEMARNRAYRAQNELQAKMIEEATEYVQTWAPSMAKSRLLRLLGHAPRHRVCEECSSELEVDLLLVHSSKLFCPNDECSAYMRPFWVDR